MSDKRDHPFYEAVPATAFVGNWELGELSEDVTRFMDRIDEVLDRFPDFDSYVEKPLELREEERLFLLDCKARLSVITDSLKEMYEPWSRYWPT